MTTLKSSTTPFSPRPTGRGGAWGQALVDLQLLLLLFLAPLFFGGRYEGGRAVFVTLVCTLAVTSAARLAVASRREWVWSGVEPLILAALVLLMSQLVAWPVAWLELLSPTVGGSLPMWRPATAGQASFGEWHTISLLPSATREALVVFAAYALLFLALVQRLRTKQDAERLTCWIAGAAACMALLGLAQFFSGTSSYLWIYPHPARSAQGHVTGSFTNQNHFAQFVVLGVGPLLWCVNRARQTSTRAKQGWHLLPLFGAGLVVLAVLLSFSRGGMLALGVALAVYGGILFQHGRLGRRELATIAACVVCIGVALSLHGYEPIARRLSSLLNVGTANGGPSQERFDLWRADWAAVHDFVLLGAGAGTHPEIYPRYMVDPYNVRFTHAENCYLQVLLETGLVGLSLLLAGIAVALSWCLRLVWRARSRLDSALSAGLCGSLAASLAHAAVDFAWYLPGCMTMTLAVLAALWRLTQECRPAPPQAPTPLAPVPVRCELAFAGLVATGVLGLMLAGHTNQTARAAVAWDAYVRRAHATSHAVLQNDQEARTSVADLIALVETTLQCDANHEQAWLRLAALHMRRFDLEQQDAENAMDLVQLRDAVEASRFPTPEAAREWMRVAIGENLPWLERAAECARRAVRLAPWRGEGYLYLAELSFLWDGAPEARIELLAQAELVRPHDGSVMFARGVVDLQQGREDEAFRKWRTMFGHNRELREKLIDLLAPQIGPTMFIVAFSPDTDSLWRLYQLYVAKGRKDEALFIGERLAPQLREAAAAALDERRGTLWTRASEVDWSLGRQPEALEALTQAIESRPHDFGLRRLLAQRASAAEQYELAAVHLKWCLQRTPFDEPLKSELARIEKLRRSKIAQGGTRDDGPPRR